MEKKNVLFMFLEVDLAAKYNLVMPYLAGYACLDPEIDTYWNFDSYRNTVHISPEQLAADMLEKDADVYAISCYVWNTKLIKKALYSFLEKNQMQKSFLAVHKFPGKEKNTCLKNIRILLFVTEQAKRFSGIT